jgi:hypothetical protein
MQQEWDTTILQHPADMEEELPTQRLQEDILLRQHQAQDLISCLQQGEEQEDLQGGTFLRLQAPKLVKGI